MINEIKINRINTVESIQHLYKYDDNINHIMVMKVINLQSQINRNKLLIFLWDHEI